MSIIDQYPCFVLDSSSAVVFTVRQTGRATRLPPAVVRTSATAPPSTAGQRWVLQYMSSACSSKTCKWNHTTGINTFQNKKSTRQPIVYKSKSKNRERMFSSCVNFVSLSGLSAETEELVLSQLPQHGRWGGRLVHHTSMLSALVHSLD